MSHVRTGYATVAPYLICDDGETVAEFLVDVFAAEVMSLDRHDDGVFRHAALRIGDGVVMVGQSAEGFGANECMVHIYVPDAKAAFDKALQQGATAVMEPVQQEYGDVSGGVRGPGGHIWWMATAVDGVR